MAAQAKGDSKRYGLDLFLPPLTDGRGFLEEMDVPVHKVASFEIVDIPLIEKWPKRESL